MTQPPPYQGGYPPQQGPHGAGGQYPPPQPTPSGFPQAGGPPSGFGPPSGGVGGPPPPPPKKSSAGRIIGGIAAVLIVGIGYFAIRYFMDVGLDEAQGKTDVADVGDCTTKSANETGTDASDVVTVSCDAKDAYFEVVKREDDPKGIDGDKASVEACTGTKAADYIYLEKETSGIDWVLCLDPIDIDTAEFGAIPADVGQCLSDNQKYFEIVDCKDSEAAIEVVTAEDNPDPSLTDASSASQVICDSTATAYYTSEFENSDVGPYEWFMCTVDVKS